MFLSDMSPFTFDAIGSANPAVYEAFCDFIKVDEIEVKNSYELACKYVDWVNNLHVKAAFAWVEKEDWIAKCNKYLESDH